MWSLRKRGKYTTRYHINEGVVDFCQYYRILFGALFHTFFIVAVYAVAATVISIVLSFIGMFTLTDLVCVLEEGQLKKEMTVEQTISCIQTAYPILEGWIFFGASVLTGAGLIAVFVAVFGAIMGLYALVKYVAVASFKRIRNLCRGVTTNTPCRESVLLAAYKSFKGKYCRPIKIVK
jgi:hypothetical protein